MFIYKITCKKNGYSYYGQTIQDPDKRLWHMQHFLRRKGLHNAALQADWQRYGEKGFEYTIIDSPPKQTWASLTALRNTYVLTDPKHYNIVLWKDDCKQIGRPRTLTDEQRQSNRKALVVARAKQRNPNYIPRAEFLAAHKKVVKPLRAVTEPWVHVKQYPPLFNQRKMRIIPRGTDLTALCAREGFDRGRLIALIKGKKKSYKHWRIIKLDI